MRVYVVFNDDGDTLAVLSELDLANGYMWQYQDCGGQCYMEEHVVDGVEVNSPGCYHDGTPKVDYQTAYDEWLAKTQWVQDTVKAGELGRHRADVLRMRIEALEAELAKERNRYMGPPIRYSGNPNEEGIDEDGGSLKSCKLRFHHGLRD